MLNGKSPIAKKDDGLVDFINSLPIDGVKPQKVPAATRPRVEPGKDDAPPAPKVAKREAGDYPAATTVSNIVNLAYDKRDGTWNINALQRIVQSGRPEDAKLALSKLQEIAAKAPPAERRLPTIKNPKEDPLQAYQGGSAVSALGNIARGDSVYAATAERQLVALGKKGGVKDEQVRVTAWRKSQHVRAKSKDEVVLSGKKYNTSQAQLMLQRRRDTALRPDAVKEREELLAFKGKKDKHVTPGNLFAVKSPAGQRADLDRMLSGFRSTRTPEDIVDRVLKRQPSAPTQQAHAKNDQIPRSHSAVGRPHVKRESAG